MSRPIRLLLAMGALILFSAYGIAAEVGQVPAPAPTPTSPSAAATSSNEPRPTGLPAPQPGTNGRPQDDARLFGPPLPPEMQAARDQAYRGSLASENPAQARRGDPLIDLPLDTSAILVLGPATRAGMAIMDGAGKSIDAGSPDAALKAIVEQGAKAVAGPLLGKLADQAGFAAGLGTQLKTGIDPLGTAVEWGTKTAIKKGANEALKQGVDVAIDSYLNSTRPALATATQSSNQDTRPAAAGQSSASATPTPNEPASSSTSNMGGCPNNGVCAFPDGSGGTYIRTRRDGVTLDWYQVGPDGKVRSQKTSNTDTTVRPDENGKAAQSKSSKSNLSNLAARSDKDTKDKISGPGDRRSTISKGGAEKSTLSKTSIPGGTGSRTMHAARKSGGIKVGGVAAKSASNAAANAASNAASKTASTAAGKAASHAAGNAAAQAASNAASSAASRAASNVRIPGR